MSEGYTPFKMKGPSLYKSSPGKQKTYAETKADETAEKHKKEAFTEVMTGKMRQDDVKHRMKAIEKVRKENTVRDDAGLMPGDEGYLGPKQYGKTQDYRLKPDGKPKK